MLTLSLLLGTCFPILLSPLFPLHAPALISITLVKVRLSLTLTLSHLTIWYLDRRLCSFSFWQRRLWRTCQLLSGTEAILSFSAGPACSSFSAETCAILQALCWSRKHHKSATSLHLPSESRSVLFSIFPFTAISLVGRNCLLSPPVLSRYNGPPGTRVSPGTTRLMS